MYLSGPDATSLSFMILPRDRFSLKMGEETSEIKSDDSADFTFSGYVSQMLISGFPGSLHDDEAAYGGSSSFLCDSDD